MNREKSILCAWKRKSADLSRWLLPVAVCFLELLFHFWVGGSISAASVLNLVGFSLAFGGILNLLASLLPPRGAKWASALSSLFCVVVVMVEFLLSQAYGSFMRPTRILTGAAGVLTDYTDVVIEMIFNNWWRILIAVIPVLLVLISGRPNASGRRRWVIASLVCCIAGSGAGFGGMAMLPGGINGYLAQYDFNAAIQEYGVIVSMVTEISGLGNREDGMTLDLTDLQVATVPEDTLQSKDPVSEVTEEVKSYAPHILPGLDFNTLAENETNSTMRTLYTYLAAQTPAMENEYTGLFRGKNLIFITAEAFNYTVIDPELTPTLYRLSTEGIQFTNYYEPLWSGCTSGGELVNLSGLAMNCEMNTYSHQKPFNTIGRLLMNEGYFSRAYHNNIYTFYDRHKTHADLGYEEFIGMGNGMEEGVKDVWPQSDMEMFDFTIPQYIDNQPFSVYYMTVSGHCRYNRLGNAQSKKNWSLVENLPYSDGVKAYIACNLELEKGLTSLVAQLEEAGIADDTVIVMAPDHYPYGLGKAWGLSHDGLAELYGVKKYDLFQRDQNTLIVWSGCLEEMDLRIDAPVCSIDILPTLSNLFGVTYDSRLSIGRDVLGTEEAISLWPDYSWVTEMGSYNATNRQFTPVEGTEVPEGYVERITSIVTNKVKFSRMVQTAPFFTKLQEELNKLQ